MDKAEDVMPNFPVDVFVGTAEYYLQFRPPYPTSLVRDLVERARLSGKGVLVDLACGPGRVTFALHENFAATWAIDLEPEMIEAGRREAARIGGANITWLVGRAEDFPGPPQPAELVTLGEAFHRLEQRKITAKALHWLKPGGSIATLGSYSVLSGREPWQRVILEVMRRWVGGRQRTSDGLELRKPDGSPAHNERIFREAGFTEVATHRFAEERVWTLDALVGYLYSCSVASRPLLGDDAGQFEAHLRKALLEHDASGEYREDPQWSYTFGRKPL
jgi:ubiquinone/menaquinone biosynthesis C-methylase UbiE